MDVAVMDNLNAYNSVHGDEVKAFAVKSAYLKERVQGDTYVNGNVVVRFPEGTPKDVQKKVLADVDTGMTHAPAAMVADKNYPIEINVGRSTVVNGETMNGLHKGDLTAEGKGGSWIGLNQDHMAQRGAVRSELKPTNGSNSGSIYPADVPFHPSVAVGKDSASFTVVHEIGHSVAAYSGTRQGGFGDKGVFYNTNRGQLGYISSYASKNTNERYAEHFAAFVFGATDQVTTEIAGVDKWRKP